MTQGYKLCPQCGEEYTLIAEQCADCRIALVSPDEVDAPLVPEAFPDVVDLECVRVGPLPWTRALSDALSGQEIGHRVEPDTRSVAEGGIDPRRFGDEPVYGTWVRSEDLAQATEVAGLLFAHLEADMAEESAGDDVCPACQEPLSSDAVECAGCGLTFA